MGIMLLNFIQGVGWIALGAFSLHYLWLLGVWAWHSRDPVPVPKRFAWLPPVTVQLPVFNERYVIARLLEAVTRLDYPRHLLEIQVLDDSTDDTSDLIAERAAALRAAGFRITHVRRAHRSGYKAGALADGLTAASGEYLALFDADFVPPPDFLRRTIHHFTDPGVGMVQTRWGHLNRTESLLTRAQAMMMDGHFLIEQVARSRGGFFFNFNGSAGIWRRGAIVSAGGWQSDTLAEDLDLSYRAQLAGWRFVYLKDVVVPAELPVDMPSFKAQYRRWAQGSIQAALKLLPAILRSGQPWPVKLEACFHFGNWFHYPFGMLAALLILPQLMTSRSLLTAHAASLWGGCMSLLLLAATAVFHAAAQRQVGRLKWRFLWELPLLMSVSVGLALNNTRAIWHALCRTPWSFHRTPKYNGSYGADAASAGYHSAGSTRWWWTEVALGVYLCVALGYAASQAFFSVVPFLLPLSAGFLYSGLSSLVPADTARGADQAGSIPSPVESIVT